MDYLQLYIYRVRPADREEFLDTMQKAKTIYRKHGADGEELFLLSNRDSKYSLTGLWNILPAAGDEDIWIGLDRYRNAAHCRDVMKKVDNDPEIEPLYERIVNMVGNASRIVRGEFEQVEY